MNIPKTIQVELLSDAAFGRGEGTAGVVDAEVEHDELGLPFLGGKTLRGLLRDAWLSMEEHFSDLTDSSTRIFGPVADFNESSILRISDAVVENGVRECIEAAENRGRYPISPTAVLEALTEIRWQTSESRKTGAPADRTLRTVRVIVRGLSLKADLHWIAQPNAADLQCLSLAMLAVRHAGQGRNRGMGYIQLTLDGNLKMTQSHAKGDGNDTC